MKHAHPLLFSPLEIGKLTLRNRICSTGHDTCLAEGSLPGEALALAELLYATGDTVGALRVANNLDAALEDRCRTKGYARVTEREQAPIAEAVALLAREAITGRQPPPSARHQWPLSRSRR